MKRLETIGLPMMDTMSSFLNQFISYYVNLGLFRYENPPNVDEISDGSVTWVKYKKIWIGIYDHPVYGPRIAFTDGSHYSQHSNMLLFLTDPVNYGLSYYKKFDVDNELLKVTDGESQFPSNITRLRYWRTYYDEYTLVISYVTEIRGGVSNSGSYEDSPILSGTFPVGKTVILISEGIDDTICVYLYKDSIPLSAINTKYIQSYRQYPYKTGYQPTDIGVYGNQFDAKYQVNSSLKILSKDIRQPEYSYIYPFINNTELTKSFADVVQRKDIYSKCYLINPRLDKNHEATLPSGSVIRVLEEYLTEEFPALYHITANHPRLMENPLSQVSIGNGTFMTVCSDYYIYSQGLVGYSDSMRFHAFAVRTDEEIEEEFITEIPKKEAGDKTELNELIGEVSGLHEIDFRVEGWNRYKKRLEEAQSVMNNNKATQYEIDVGYAHLRDAYERLKEVEIENIVTDNGDELLYENDEIMITEESNTNIG